ncbi:MAG: FUSC family protein, partial [Treponema sp.]|nr:FUSC family protein [Treponema sp.]
MEKMKPELSAQQPSAKLQQSAGAGIEMIAVVLPVFWSMIQLFAWWKPPLDAIVFAVMLGVMFPRAMKRIRLNQLHFAVIAAIAGSAAAAGCGMLIQDGTGLRILGAVLFAAGVALPVWVRRFGEIWKTSGTVFTMPFMAILVHPVALDQNAVFFGWELAAVAIALFWTLIVKVIAGEQGISGTQDSAQPVSAKKHELLSSTKMAIQLAAAIAAAFLYGELVDPDHLVWPVLTVLIVHSGNNGRGDLLWKGIQRTVSALLGVTIASLIAFNMPPGTSIEIVAIFAILVFAAMVREFSYMFWAVCIPAALVFLYSFFGQTGAELANHLAHRLLGVATGSAAGIISGFFILPVRMTDVVRLRLGAVLSAAGDFAVSAARGKADPVSQKKLESANNELLH